MAKIVTKGFEEFIVPEDKARALAELMDEKKKAENSGGLPLSAWPITIEHADGLWCGSLSNIGPISLSEKQRVRKFFFKNEADLQRFHQEYGYSAFKNYNLHSYGMVDVMTQFLIKTSQAKIEDGNLVILNSPHKEQWGDLWYDYQSNLDEFNELK